MPPVTTPKPALGQRRAEGLARCRRRSRAYALNSGCARLARGHRDGGGHVVVRPALQAREDGLVDRGRVLLPCRRSCRRAGRGTSCASWTSPRRRCRRARGAPRRRRAPRCARCRRPGWPPPRRRSARKAAKSSVRGYAVVPHQRSFGLCSRARSRTWSMSMRWSSLRTPYCTLLKYLPVIDTVCPCVRCPPAGRARPMMVSPGCAEGEVHREVRGAARVGLHVDVVGAEEGLEAARWPAPRPGRRPAGPRSSACARSPRSTCWSAPSRSPPSPRARRSSRLR